MRKELYEVIKLIEALGGRLKGVEKERGGVNVYIFSVNEAEIKVSARCLKSFLKALKQLTNKEV